MRDIKAKFHFEKIEHSYWLPGFYIYTYIRISISVTIYYPSVRWVPGYMLWGWIPIPGLYRAKYTATYGMTIRISHYVPPRKVTYYTYIRVADSHDIPVYFAYKVDNRYQQRLQHSTQLLFGSTIFTIGFLGRQLVGITQGYNQIYAGLDEYSKYSTETGRSDDYRFSDPLFYIGVHLGADYDYGFK